MLTCKRFNRHKCPGWSGPFNQRKAKCWEGLQWGPHRPGIWGRAPASCAFLAGSPPSSSVLEKQKSARQQAARQAKGTRLLEGVVGLSLLRWQ